MHINFAYDILNKIFLDCIIEAKNVADERKGAVKMLTTLARKEKILAIIDKNYSKIKVTASFITTGLIDIPHG